MPLSRRAFGLALAFLLLFLGSTGAQEKPSVKPAPQVPASQLVFAALGDTGTGELPQLAVAKQMITAYERTPFAFILLLGDNLYASSWKRIGPAFEQPYKYFLDKNVPFYATLGNHDQFTAAEQLKYEKFNMDGSRTYSFKPAGTLAEFFTFDSTLTCDQGDTAQLAWLDKALSDSTARWKILFIHHPPFSAGSRHGDNPILETRLVPILERHHVNIVMTGHEHFFARMATRNGVSYIISGSGGKIHRGGLTEGVKNDSRLIAGNDQVHQFLLVRLTADAFEYTVIGEGGQTIYNESIPYAAPAKAAAAAN